MSTYRVEPTELAEAERDAVYLRLNRLFGPEYAARWLTGLMQAMNALGEFPGPRSHPRDEKTSERLRVGVRRMLYHGPGKRRSGTPYRVLFTINEPAPGENEGVVRVLRILHGAADPFSPEPADQESA